MRKSLSLLVLITILVSVPIIVSTLNPDRRKAIMCITSWGTNCPEKDYENVTVVVLTPDIPPIPLIGTVIRIESDRGFAIQNMTDSLGRVFFRSLTGGKYKIGATQVFCSDKKTEARKMTVEIRDHDTHIEYYPCYWAETDGP